MSTFQNQNVTLTTIASFPVDGSSITGRGTVASGRIDRVKRRNQNRWYQRRISKAVVTGAEMFRKQLDEGLAGDNVGVLRGVQRRNRT